MGKNNKARKEQKQRMIGRIVLWESELKSLNIERIVNHLVGVLNIGDVIQLDEVKRILAEQFEKGEFNPDDFRGVIHDSRKVETLFEALYRGGFLQEEAFLPNASSLKALGMKSLG